MHACQLMKVTFIVSLLLKINLQCISLKVFSSGSTLAWYYIVGAVSGCIVLFAIGWYVCKRRRAGKNLNNRFLKKNILF